MYLIHSSQKTKLYLKQIPNGHDEMATGGRWILGQYSPKFTFAFDFSSAFVFDMILIHTFVHSRKFWEFEWYDLQNMSLFHVSLKTWYREYLNTLLVLLSLKKTCRYRIISICNTSHTECNPRWKYIKEKNARYFGQVDIESGRRWKWSCHTNRVWIYLEDSTGTSQCWDWSH